MSEWGALSRRLRECRDRGESVALATVVATEGSAYRRAGAWMTVSPDGARHGLLSGGCLEADVAERAARALASGVPELATYDTRRDGDFLWGFGMGCLGVVRVWIEPLSGATLGRTADLFGRLESLSGEGVLAVVVSYGAPDTPGSPDRPSDLSADGPSAGDRVLVTWAGEVVDLSRGMRPEVLDRARQRLASNVDAPSVETVAGLEVSFLRVVPRIRLLICGAGEDAVPLARLAGDLDWSVLVVDHRAALARSERFPGAKVAVVEKGSDVSSLLDPPLERTAAVVMSHNLERDVDWTAGLLALDLGYLGLLGPKRRGEQVLRTATSLAAGPARVRRILAPIGLDISSETPREIALAIVAEISAVLSGRSGGHLAERTTPIHRESAESDAVRREALEPSS